MPDIIQQIKTLQDQMASHQHQGGDGSQRIALLDWKLLARNTLPVAATSLIALDIPPRTFMRVFVQYGARSTTGNIFLRANADVGANYTFIEETTAVARTSRTEIDLIDALANDLGYFHIIDIVNIPSLVKSITVESIARITSAATAQSHLTIKGTWVNTANALTRLDIISSTSATFPANSSITIMGTNF